MDNSERVRVINKEGDVKFIPKASVKYAKDYGYDVQDLKSEDGEDEEFEMLKNYYKELTGNLPGRMKKETLEARIKELEEKK